MHLIVIQALKRETDPLSKQRRQKLEAEVQAKRAEESSLLAEWEKEKKALNEAKVCL